MIFLTTTREKDTVRLVPVSGQKLDDGTAVDVKMYVQGDKAIRSMYPLGTIFVVDGLAPQVNFYRAVGNIKVVDADASPEDIAPDAAFAAYEALMAGKGSGTAAKAPPKAEVRKDTYLAKLKSKPYAAVPDPVIDGFYVHPDAWYLLLRNIEKVQNTMLVGPTGTGKTELAMLATGRLDIPLNIHDMGSMHDPLAGLLGVHRLEKGGVSKFEYAKFATDIQREGGILLDELSRAPVTSNNLLFPCLDSRRTLPCAIAGEGDIRDIKVHADCFFIATANVGSEYTGTMSMDKALVNRFIPIEIDYMPPAIEVKVLQARCGITTAEATSIVDNATKIRALYLKQELSTSVGHRDTLMAGHLIADGYEAKKASEHIFVPMFEGTREEGERSIIFKMLK